MAEKAGYPCTKFLVDVNGGFSECGTCKWDRESHKPMTRKKLKKAAEKKKTEAKPFTVANTTSKEAQPCDNYRVDVARTGYAVCLCGWTEQEHVEFAQEQARIAKEEEERRQAQMLMKDFREVARENGVACEKFEVDVTNESGGYGICLCGKPREEHFEFGTNGKKYEDVRETLTQPKEFT